MASDQGALELLHHPVAQELLHSTNVARLAYTWSDGTPRVIPIWFHWTGEEVVFGTPVDAPKMEVLRQGSPVALTIDDDNVFPHKALLMRGTASVQIVEGIVPEYAAAAERHFGAEQGRAWVGQVSTLAPQMARIAVRPAWVGLLDFQTRFPSALERAMAQQQASANASPVGAVPT